MAGLKKTINSRFYKIVEQIKKKRMAAQRLSTEEVVLLVADSIMDGRFFQAPGWRWRYGGIRYVPCSIEAENPSKILVLQWPGPLGDVAMSAPAIAALRKRYPNAEIHCLSGKAGNVLFEKNSHVDVLLENPLEAYSQMKIDGQFIEPRLLVEAIVNLVTMLKRQRYSLVVNLQVLPMSAGLARLLGPENMVGLTLSEDGMPVIYGNVWAPYLFAVSANLLREGNQFHRSLVFKYMVDDGQMYEAGPKIGVRNEARKRVSGWFKDWEIEDRQVVVGVCPGASAEYKRWKNYRKLACRIVEELDTRVLVFGNRREKDLVSNIAPANVDKRILGITEFDIQELMAAFDKCSVIITNDSGPMHVASLLNRKVVALFGPTLPEEVGPWGTKYIVIQSGDCGGPHKQSHTSRNCPNVDGISVGDVLAAVRRMASNTLTVTKGVICAGSDVAVSTEIEKWNEQSLVFKVLECRERGVDLASLESMVDERTGHRLCAECDHLLQVVECALSDLGRDGKNSVMVGTREADAGIRNVSGHLQPVVIMNDFKYLDKRFSPLKPIESHKRFYEGVAEDVQAIKRVCCMQ